MTAGALLGLTLVSLLVTTLAAVAALILHEFPAHELEELCRRRRREELFGDVLDQHEQAAMGMQSLQAVGTAMFLVAGLWWFTEVLGEGGAADWFRYLVCAAVGSAMLLAATVWLPWAMCRFWSAPLLFWMWPLLRAVGLAFLPFTLAGGLFEEILRRLAGRPAEILDEEEAFEDEIRAIVSEGLHDGLLEADAREMIEGVIELGDVDVADIMTPRSRMDALQIDMGWQAVLEFVVRVARTRIPVYGESLDDVRGILYVKDLLPELAKDVDQRSGLAELIRPAAFVPATKAVDDLLREFQRSHNHMAIVVDEYHGVAGLITIEDVLEEIVGEIVDEHDQEEQDDIRPLDDGSAEVLASTHLDEVNDRLGLDLPEDDEIDTVGGLVLSRLERIPVSDEILQIGNVRITVLAATPRRIERVRIDNLERAQQETA